MSVLPGQSVNAPPAPVAASPPSPFLSPDLDLVYLRHLASLWPPRPHAPTPSPYSPLSLLPALWGTTKHNSKLFQGSFLAVAIYSCQFTESLKVLEKLLNP